MPKEYKNTFQKRIFYFSNSLSLGSGLTKNFDKLEKLIKSIRYQVEHFYIGFLTPDRNVEYVFFINFKNFSMMLSVQYKFGEINLFALMITSDIIKTLPGITL